ncbi:hypothetical protein L1N82_12440 [Paenibacillus tarimensis]|nr:hypothetical protein [Paenibacillus tarimensis]MCF2944423.1 hypothetical protein [Paenibacillus tarimensis]
MCRKIIHSQDRQHFSKTGILAVGGGILNPQKLEIEGAERYELTNFHNELFQSRNHELIKQMIR